MTNIKTPRERRRYRERIAEKEAKEVKPVQVQQAQQVQGQGKEEDDLRPPSNDARARRRERGLLDPMVMESKPKVKEHTEGKHPNLTWNVVEPVTRDKPENVRREKNARLHSADEEVFRQGLHEGPSQYFGREKPSASSLNVRNARPYARDKPSGSTGSDRRKLTRLFNRDKHSPTSVRDKNVPRPITREKPPDLAAQEKLKHIQEVLSDKKNSITDKSHHNVDSSGFSHDFPMVVSDFEYGGARNQSHIWSVGSKVATDQGKGRQSDWALSVSSTDKQDGSNTSLKTRSINKLPNKEKFSYVKILATLLPDEILRDIKAVEPKAFPAALLFADVSGFTVLSEKFDKTGLGGPSRLTEILNKHIGAMIQVVLSKNGDVCKFGGDAIFVFWKASPPADLSAAVSNAIDSALNIQKNCQNLVDGVNEIRIKISVTAGDVTFSVLGEKRRKYYMLIGTPVMEMSNAEKLCNPGEIIVSPSAWNHVLQATQYNFMKHSNKVHVLIQDFGPNWNHKKSQSESIRDTISVRPNLKLAANIEIEQIRPFILPFVMKCVDRSEPLDYLTEMRQVTIVFLRVELHALPSLEMIGVCNDVYQRVCHIVEKTGGVVNKLTCFDKDVSILIVFGLRGFKHELASKVALKCASNCLDMLKIVTQANVAAGVTTGMVYCGVIGHLLRKEYTVMGLPVNKAARLMCAYENIVACDRETFLQSKLRSTHFTILEQKSLKGIQHVGPVYEFNLSSKRFKVTLGTNNQPLLGRSKEIHEFMNFITHYNNGNPTNFFLVYGHARIGKTRLITELVHIAEKFFAEQGSARKQGHSNDSRRSNLDVCFIQLSEEDYKSSYSTIRLMYQPALGLNESSTPEEREEKIISKLGDVKGAHILSSLNTIFNVKFNTSMKYQNLSEEEKMLAKEMVRKMLHRMCFPMYSNWLIVIDDAEFIDEASWVYLRWCCTISRSPLFLIAIGRQKPLTASASDCLFSIPQKKVILEELDKWHNTALACQILGVKAIPVELEDLLQGFKRTGNPGWLESYLMSLIQSESLKVIYLTWHQMEDMRLVTAPEDMSGKYESGLPKEYFNTAASSYWLNWIEPRKTEYSDNDEIIPVCVLGPNFENTRKDSELTMDMMYVKTVDKLKPLEQLILKIGSVLGYNFRRDALVYLVSKEHPSDEKTFGKAIMTLFEIRILCCDTGNFTCPSSLITNRRVILGEDFQKDIKCNCVGLVRSEALQNFPNYASCGFMRFRNPVFRDTMYNLLLDEQKKKYNYLTIEFLCSHTYRCKACHSVLFERILGEEVNGQIRLLCNKTSIHGVRSTKVKIRTKNFGAKKPPPPDLPDMVASKDIILRDVSDCQCSQILSTVYATLQDCAEKAGRKDILLEVSLEYASVNLTSHNVPLTCRILEDTLHLMRSMQNESVFPELTTPFVFAKVYTLMGASNLYMGRYDTALELLDIALKYLGKSVPRTKLQQPLVMLRADFKMKWITNFAKAKFNKSVKKNYHFFDLLSQCYDVMCNAHLDLQNNSLAKYTSVKAMGYALRSHKNFYSLCTSCANLLEVCYIYNEASVSAKIELLAIDICEQSNDGLLEMYELEAIARLYKVIFKASIQRDSIPELTDI
ncbi:UNVERIFIED_CONTAM: hypothetical protein PYX00_000659 [Menopon gallinae]|uniref:Guanylate cyclase domain-containing protein n=1 Tax=Menopon gallinae TaxID=328185 RepID=A0AAW2I9G6_9NEOP